MRKTIYIGVGGALGAILRYLITEVPIQNYVKNIPLNTLFINISGCFVLGVILTLSFELKFSPNVRLGIATGFLGAYTTFSSVARQAVDLIAGGHYFLAIEYLFVSVALGFGAAYFGVIVGREIVARRVKGKISAIKENEAE